MGPEPVSESELAEARDLLCELVSIPSASGAEGRITERLEDWAHEHAVPNRRVPAENGRESLVLGDSREPVLAIAAHVDTVSATWPEATVPRVVGNTVHGLGAVDDKGGVLACLLAARALARRGVNFTQIPAVFAFPVDEETSGSGSRALAIDLSPRFAIALEGSSLRPGTAECGDLEAMVHVHGVAAHGSLVELGDNAAHAAAKLIAGLESLGLGGEEHPLLGASVASVTEVSTGDGMNVVPDSCSLRLRIRLIPGQDLQETIHLIESYAAGFNATVEMVEGTVPFELPGNSPLLDALDGATLAVLGEKRGPIGVPAWTDAHNFVDFGGSEAIVFGPGSIETAHTPEEHIDVTEIVQCSRIFTRLLEPESIGSLRAADPRPDPARYRKELP